MNKSLSIWVTFIIISRALVSQGHVLIVKVQLVTNFPHGKQVTVYQSRPQSSCDLAKLAPDKHLYSPKALGVFVFQMISISCGNPRNNTLQEKKKREKERKEKNRHLMSSLHWIGSIHALLSSLNQSPADGCVQCGAANKWPFQTKTNGVFRKMLCLHAGASTEKHIPCVHSHQRVEHHLKRWSGLKAGEWGKRQAGSFSKTSDKKGSQSPKCHVHNVIPE